VHHFVVLVIIVVVVMHVQLVQLDIIVLEPLLVQQPIQDKQLVELVLGLVHQLLHQDHVQLQIVVMATGVVMVSKLHAQLVHG
jgi:hypothetical protein